ncbi:MAG: 16S rRNA (cytosine(1402)-N(4))-methyltransferase [Flavobacteriales bacterium]|nr:16S rRNA (cytosine(1402)-N(4))-methyltransferase [Flavobacteriales bacterium]|tara:strand:- start:12280 stop:13182 length:903 start_codon:yes stop_codon:yes gene_type:complete
MNEFHKSVLLKDSVEGLKIKPNGIYVDVTFGGGGHSREIIKSIIEGKLIAFDQDKEAIKNKIIDKKNFMIFNKNFKNLKTQLNSINIFAIDGLIADLGVSAYQFTDNERGFSLKYDANLDMRMDQDLEKTAFDVINKYNRENLSRIFKDYADFKNPNFIVDEIISSRNSKIIQTTFDLKKIFNNKTIGLKDNKFFARIFQAIRIEINDEINILKELLSQSLELLRPKGRLVVLSYHSAEDKIVKSFMKYGNFLNTPKKDFFGNISTPFRLVTKKPIVPSVTEINQNNKSRSAKLRICEKL